MPPGQTTVPASASTSTWAKYWGSLSGSRTPVQCSPEKSTSPTVPSLNRSRSTCSPSTATPTTAGRYFSLTAFILRQWFYVSPVLQADAQRARGGVGGAGIEEKPQAHRLVPQSLGLGGSDDRRTAWPVKHPCHVYLLRIRWLVGAGRREGAGRS